jgi:putative endopeptidase
LPGLHIKGDVTLGDNIADLGGVTIALTAYYISLHGSPAPVIDGYKGEQRLFLCWAQSWREKIRDDALRRMVASDVHSPALDRVDGVVRNMDAWYTAFDVMLGETLYLEPSDRVDIW